MTTKDPKNKKQPTKRKKTTRKSKTKRTPEQEKAFQAAVEQEKKRIRRKAMSKAIGGFIFKVVSVIAVFGVITFFVLLFNGVFIPVAQPKIEIEDAVIVNGVAEVEYSSFSNIEIRVNPGNAHIDKANLKLTINGVEHKPNDGISCGDNCWLISSSIIEPNDEFKIVAQNTAGTDSVTLKIGPSKTPSYSSGSSNSSSSSKYDERQTTTHLLCKQYARQYFAPYEVKFHDILGVKYDQLMGSSWVYNLTVTVGGVDYDVDCKVGNFNSAGTNGEVQMFEALPE